MKKGILTFHKANNLGAVLQAYALQKKMSHIFNNDIIEIIDYDNGNFVERSNINSIKSFFKNIYYFIKNNSFNKFRKKYLIMSNNYNKDNIKKSINDYDCIICGSDQIWNLSCSNNDYNYFLDFAKDNKKTKKISYAASIGNYHYTNEEKEKVLNIINKFDKLSIREKDSIKEFEDFNLKIEIMPDPVFLLEKEEWIKIMPRKQTKSKYIFVYLIQEDVNVMNAAKKYAKKNKCIIISNKKNLKFFLNNSPDKFLSWIYYADAVFTNSFHGTAFSLIFEKKLGADIALKNGGINNRIIELLKSTKNEQCIIDSNRIAANKVKNCELINDMRNKGEKYLKKI